MHEPDPDTAFVSGAAKANPVGLRTAGLRWKDSTGLLIAVSSGTERKPSM